eukprot:gnl/TRDRNA2_/TRDRNA2_129505_c0_seq1.p1 gnl/TRDRNA2_/TRDRNA2_129505_c0~~gnl/TRDRNA2_/TRDRNA2_129505_c0_seq1.p1  ORF type:complete len:545 (+),score=55.34 gnl/TRDRNA2_/TRDRNA2_129505_c0_seq1:150-1637(+)
MASAGEAGTPDNEISMEFCKLGLRSDIAQAMDSKKITEPSPVQKQVIPRLIAGESLVMAACTGSGKTLAYLLPVIQNMRHQESKGYERLPKRPRCLVLVPTRELARQVLSEVKSVSHYCKVSSAVVLGGEPASQQKQALSRAVDVVVATPGRLVQHFQQGNVLFNQVMHVVVDEVDTMLTQGFGSEIRDVLRGTLRGKPKEGKGARCQLIMASATLTPGVQRLLSDANKLFESSIDDGMDAANDVNNLAKKTDPDDDEAESAVRMRIVEVDGVHRTLPNVRHDFVETKGTDKLVLLRTMLQQKLPGVQSARKNVKYMVFCNKLNSCVAIEKSLAELGVNCLPYHSGLKSQDRDSNLVSFRESTETGCDVLVCTDIAARGLDIPDIDHVVIYDFPLNPVDYIHRSGRTGRAGKKGRVTSLVNKRDEVLSNAIQGAIERGLPLDSLTSARADYRPGGALANVLGHGNAPGRQARSAGTRSEKRDSGRRSNRGDRRSR